MSPGNICEGCGNNFPRLSGFTDNCGRCELLATHPTDSEKYQEIQNWPQCTICGKCFRNMNRVEGSSQICGTPECRALATGGSSGLCSSSVPPAPNSLYLTPPVLNNPGVSETEFNRINATRNRLKLAPVFRNSTPGTNLTTASLKQQEQAAYPLANEAMALVCWSYRRSDRARSLDPKLGSGSQTFNLSTFIPDIQSHILDALNIEWLKAHTSRLHLNEISLRFGGNIVLEDGTTTIILREFIKHYSTPGKQLLTSSNIPHQHKHLMKSQKIPIVTLEGFIHIEMYEKRSNQTEQGSENYPSEMIVNIGRRRRHRSDSISSSSQLTKQPRTASATHRTRSTSALGSMFSPAQSTSHTIHKSTNIVFKKILCTINSDDGSASFNELSDIVHGFLHNQHFGKGSMKAAHELILSSGGHHGRHVAKRFFRVANDDAPSSPRHLGLGGIEIRAHNIYIQAECRRLLQGQWFLSAFYMLCAKSNVSVDDRLQFADAFLLQEDMATTPSPASGAKSYTNETDGVMWLVEKRRPNSLIRFSGTLSHPSSNSDLRSSTIYALAHFSYGHSNKSLVFADLQGSPTNLNGRDGFVLFDPMTHTLDGNSGIGDFGPEGINTFIRDHQCGEICRRIGLHEDIPLQIIDESEERDNTPQESNNDCAGREKSPNHSSEEEG